MFLQKIVGLSEEDEVEESMSALVMGNLVHYGLEYLYRPFEGKSIPSSMLMSGQREQWKPEYKDWLKKEPQHHP